MGNSRTLEEVGMLVAASGMQAAFWDKFNKSFLKAGGTNRQLYDLSVKDQEDSICGMYGDVMGKKFASVSSNGIALSVGREAREQASRTRNGNLRLMPERSCSESADTYLLEYTSFRFETRMSVCSAVQAVTFWNRGISAAALWELEEAIHYKQLPDYDEGFILLPGTEWKNPSDQMYVPCICHDGIDGWNMTYLLLAGHMPHKFGVLQVCR